MGPTFQPSEKYVILSISVSSTITCFASRCVIARKKTSAAAKGKRGNASVPKAPKALESWLSMYPNIQGGGIDRLLRVEESKTGIVGSEQSQSTEKQRKARPTTYDWILRREAQMCQGRLPKIRTGKDLRRRKPYDSSFNTYHKLRMFFPVPEQA